MNRYDYYTRCACIDEQEWLTEELYYPESDNNFSAGRRNSFDNDDEEDALYQEFAASFPDDCDIEEGEGELWDEEWDETDDFYEETERR